MRILVNAVTPTPGKLTGLSVYTWRILEALIARGDHEYVLATNYDHAAIPSPVRDGVTLVARRVPANETAAVLANSLELPRLAARHGCAAIFHPQPTAALTAGSRSVVVVHDLYRVTHPDLYPWRNRIQWQLGIVGSLRRAAAVIAVSRATRDSLLAAYPWLRDRVQVVHEASPITPDAGDADGASPGEPYALVVANITPNKNIETIIGALQLLARAGRRPRVVLVGQDPAGVLTNLLADGPGLALDRRASVDATELRRLYAGARAYLNASFVEGFCLPVLEAQSYGVPVICSDLPVLREVGGDGALFVDPRRPDLFADAIGRLFDRDDLHADLARRARVNAARFSWTKAAAETVAVLEAVAERN